MNKKKIKQIAIVWRAAGQIYVLISRLPGITTFHNVPEGCILFFKSYYANDRYF
jgi:hypothetical protein